MSDIDPTEHTEEALRRLPARRLAPEARRRILDALGEAAPPAPWRAPVPAWVATAAALVCSALTFALTARFMHTPVRPRTAIAARAAVRETPPPELITLAQPLFERSHRASHQPRISEWSVISVEPQEIVP